eukprot:6181247-Pleurochrysis_carterae.AAC.5
MFTPLRLKPCRRFLQPATILASHAVASFPCHASHVKPRHRLLVVCHRALACARLPPRPAPLAAGHDHIQRAVDHVHQHAGALLGEAAAQPVRADARARA